MRHVGIICEYNPFHSGHAHLIGRVRGAKTVICLMSGPFTQRGEAALLPPVERAAMAIRAGADLVLELPFPYAAGSARYFAEAGVRALAGLGVDSLAFGSESADADAIVAAAGRSCEADFIKKVANVPQNTGDAAAFFAALGEARVPPNDILAVEYARAARVGKFDLELLPILRVGAGYHSTDATAAFPSATALRAKLAAGEGISGDLPLAVRAQWCAALSRWGGVADTRRLGAPMLAALRAMNAKEAATGVKTGDAAFADCAGGLLERLMRAAAHATDYEGLCRAAATKRYTDGRIRRALLYLIGGVTREDLASPPAYLRLLAANERGRKFLSETRKSRTVPVVTKPCEIKALGKGAQRAAALQQLACGLYALCMPNATDPAVLLTQPPYLI